MDLHATAYDACDDGLGTKRRLTIDDVVFIGFGQLLRMLPKNASSSCHAVVTFVEKKMEDMTIGKGEKEGRKGEESRGLITLI